MPRTPRVQDDEIFVLRLARSAEDLWPMLDALYGQRADYPAFREALLAALRKGWKDRPTDLRSLDLKRDLEPDWFQRSDRAGYVFYIDRFAGNLRGVLDKIDYLQDLGISYVHSCPA
jgi:amylosucrase